MVEQRGIYGLRSLAVWRAVSQALPEFSGGGHVRGTGCNSRCTGMHHEVQVTCHVGLRHHLGPTYDSAESTPMAYLPGLLLVAGWSMPELERAPLTRTRREAVVWDV